MSKTEGCVEDAVAAPDGDADQTKSTNYHYN